MEHFDIMMNVTIQTYYSFSMDKYKAIQDKDEKAERLKRRRLKLGQMLREERNSWEV
jgi:hypothetical protein